MQKYKCHKTVSAFKIALIGGDEFGAAIADAAFVGESVSFEWFDKNKPVVGGYFVSYDDGHKVFLSAKAFEADFTLCDAGSTVAEALNVIGERAIMQRIEVLEKEIEYINVRLGWKPKPDESYRPHIIKGAGVDTKTPPMPPSDAADVAAMWPRRVPAARPANCPRCGATDVPQPHVKPHCYNPWHRDA